MDETLLLDNPHSHTSQQSSIILKAINAIELVNHITPELKILNGQRHPQSEQEILATCIYAGQQLAREVRIVLPLLPESLYLLGGICIAAGKMAGNRQLITHNRLCEQAGKLLKDEKAGESFYIIRSISLPVYRRLVREERTGIAALLQSMLHILAWRSDNSWVREQAQRMLWMGGVFGTGGMDSLFTFDLDIAEKDITFPSLRELLTVTAFLAQFPAGPIFSD